MIRVLKRPGRRVGKSRFPTTQSDLPESARPTMLPARTPQIHEGRDSGRGNGRGPGVCTHRCSEAGPSEGPVHFGVRARDALQAPQGEAVEAAGGSDKAILERGRLSIGRRSRPHPAACPIPLLTKSRSSASGLSAGSRSSSPLFLASALGKPCFPIRPSPFSSVNITYPAKPGGTVTSSPRRLRPRNDTWSPTGENRRAPVRTPRGPGLRAALPAPAANHHAQETSRGSQGLLGAGADPRLTIGILADGGREETLHRSRPVHQDLARQEV
jgi:hypothetical protein